MLNKSPSPPVFIEIKSKGSQTKKAKKSFEAAKELLLKILGECGYAGGPFELFPSEQFPGHKQGIRVGHTEPLRRLIHLSVVPGTNDTAWKYGLGVPRTLNVDHVADRLRKYVEDATEKPDALKNNSNDTGVGLKTAFKQGSSFLGKAAEIGAGASGEVPTEEREVSNVTHAEEEPEVKSPIQLAMEALEAKARKFEEANLLVQSDKDERRRLQAVVDAALTERNRVAAELEQARAHFERAERELVAAKRQLGDAERKNPGFDEALKIIGDSEYMSAATKVDKVRAILSLAK